MPEGWRRIHDLASKNATLIDYLGREHYKFHSKPLTMALPNPKKYTKPEYDNLPIVKFNNPPGTKQKGNPDDKVRIEPQGWIGSDVLAFIIVNDAQNGSTATTDTLVADTLNVDVVSDMSQKKTTTYWTVDMGAGNGKPDLWKIEFEVKRDDRKTGKWIFTKGNDDDDGDSKPGCLGFVMTLLP